MNAPDAVPDSPGGAAASLPPDVARRPWRHGFLDLMRRLAARHPDMPEVGRAQRPQLENFRLGQQAFLGFAPREIAQVQEVDGRMHLRLFGLGALGPNGGLPLHVTEWVRERQDTKRDATMGDFLDMFHHRMFSHFYRAWAQSQSAGAGLDRTGQETFTPYVARLGGDEPAQAALSALPPHARWASIAHRVRSARNPDGLVAAIGQFFNVPVRMEEFRLHWMPLDDGDECRLGWPRPSSLLGQGAIAGEVVPDRQTRFRLVIGPVDLEQYLRFTPQGVAKPLASAGIGGATREGEATHQICDLPALVDLVRTFIGFEYVWEVELLVHLRAAPPCRLGVDNHLGWSTWMEQTDPNAAPAISGMLFEPEAYAQRS